MALCPDCGADHHVAEDGGADALAVAEIEAEAASEYADAIVESSELVAAADAARTDAQVAMREAELAADVDIAEIHADAAVAIAEADADAQVAASAIIADALAAVPDESPEPDDVAGAGEAADPVDEDAPPDGVTGVDVPPQLKEDDGRGAPAGPKHVSRFRARRQR